MLNFFGNSGLVTLCVTVLALTYSPVFVDSSIVCYECHASITACQEKRPNAFCSDEKPYCMFSWNKRTGRVAQGCADTDLCGNPRSKKRDVYYPYPSDPNYEMISYTDEMINCCNYDFCNCVGTQCKPFLMNGNLVSPSVRTITFAGLVTWIIALLR